MTFLKSLIFIITIIGGNIDEKSTDQQGEKSGKKDKRPKKKHVEIEEPVVGKRCQRLHAVDNLLTIS